MTADAAAQFDVDHVVPLKEAWRSGAAEWSTQDRRAFANDLVHSQLVAVSARSNGWPISPERGSRATPPPCPRGPTGPAGAVLRHLPRHG
ncbi:DUF1524 domain-containing protein [Streptomyces sp. NPDC005962]|uniref:GmrSD restriction endonuclease domain-containing protein n=1 Tax=Streptomyces sp. NPDC005962 TaxID=3154466 RepID=UPI0033C3DF7C